MPLWRCALALPNVSCSVMLTSLRYFQACVVVPMCSLFILASRFCNAYLKLRVETSKHKFYCLFVTSLRQLQAFCPVLICCLSLSQTSICVVLSGRIIKRLENKCHDVNKHPHNIDQPFEDAR